MDFQAYFVAIIIQETLNVVISSGNRGTFTEKIWLAKDVGVVKTFRESETPTDYDGCLFTCAAFEDDRVQNRYLNLQDYVVLDNPPAQINLSPSTYSPYTMMQYFPLNSGNIQMFDRNAFVVGPETRDFAAYRGQAYIDAFEYGDVLYFYSGIDGIFMVGMLEAETGSYIDISSTPIKVASGQMKVGDQILSNLPSGALGYSKNITSTLEAVEDVVSPAGTFLNTLKLNVVISSGNGGTFTEKIWLAKDVGVVKTFRESENPDNYDGCLFTCAAFNNSEDTVEQRAMNLLSYVIQDSLYDTPSKPAIPGTLLLLLTSEEVCDSSHLDLCATESVCSAAGGYWWSDDTCNETMEQVSSATPLNDTGITFGGDYSSGNTTTCTSNVNAPQDCSLGRDATSYDDSDGHAGFSFTKLDANGNGLDASATGWSCVRDNVTGLIWEVKTDDGGLHDKDDRYNWYNTDPTSNGGFEGYADYDGDICYGYNSTDPSSYCNTQAYTARVNNQGLCGASDWRMPTRQELLSIVNMDYNNPIIAIDTDYFPHKVSSYVWSASPYVYSKSWYVDFTHGRSSVSDRSNYNCVRLVRGGK